MYTLTGARLVSSGSPRRSPQGTWGNQKDPGERPAIRPDDGRLPLQCAGPQPDRLAKTRDRHGPSSTIHGLCIVSTRANVAGPHSRIVFGLLRVRLQAYASLFRNDRGPVALAASGAVRASGFAASQLYWFGSVGGCCGFRGARLHRAIKTAAATPTTTSRL